MDQGGETPALYTILPEKKSSVGGAMMGSAHVYDTTAVSAQYIECQDINSIKEAIGIYYCTPVTVKMRFLSFMFLFQIPYVSREIFNMKEWMEINVKTRTKCCDNSKREKFM
jgi:hypothetical protein